MNNGADRRSENVSRLASDLQPSRLCRCCRGFAIPLAFPWIADACFQGCTDLHSLDYRESDTVCGGEGCCLTSLVLGVAWPL